MKVPPVEGIGFQRGGATGGLQEQQNNRAMLSAALVVTARTRKGIELTWRMRYFLLGGRASICDQRRGGPSRRIFRSHTSCKVARWISNILSEGPRRTEQLRKVAVQTCCSLMSRNSCRM